MKVTNLCRVCRGVCRVLCRVNPACLLGCAGCAGVMRVRTREIKIFFNKINNILSRVESPLHTLHTLHTQACARLADMRTPAHTPAHPCTGVYL